MSIMEKEVDKKRRQDKENSQRANKEWRRKEAEEYVPEVRDEPYVHVPLRCKCEVHKKYQFEAHDKSHMSNVKMCVVCGAVFVGELLTAFHWRFAGYGNPNKQYRVFVVSKKSTEE